MLFACRVESSWGEDLQVKDINSEQKKTFFFFRKFQCISLNSCELKTFCFALDENNIWIIEEEKRSEKNSNATHLFLISILWIRGGQNFTQRSWIFIRIILWNFLKHHQGNCCQNNYSGWFFIKILVSPTLMIKMYQRKLLLFAWFDIIVKSTTRQSFRGKIKQSDFWRVAKSCVYVYVVRAWSVEQRNVISCDWG